MRFLEHRFSNFNLSKGKIMTEIFAAIDLSTVATAVIGIGVVVMAITMSYKGIDLGKRGVKKA